MVRATLLGEHYTSKVLNKKVDKKSKNEYWKIELLPKKDAVTTWGKVILDINKTDLLPIKQRYYDEDQKLVRTITYSNVKKIDKRIIPTIVKVVPESPKDEYTQITYNKIDYSVEIDDSFFSLTRLKNLK